MNKKTNTITIEQIEKIEAEIKKNEEQLKKKYNYEYLKMLEFCSTLDR